MNDTEKDPRRCRELRQIERDIEISIGRAKADRDRASGFIASQRAQRSALMTELSRLDTQWKAKLALSALRGPAGLAAGVEAGNIALQMAKVKGDIQAINRNIQMEMPEYERAKNQLEHWTQSLRVNTARMDNLACVR